MLKEEKELRKIIRASWDKSLMSFSDKGVVKYQQTDERIIDLITALVRAVREDDAKTVEECKVRFSGRINNRVHVDEVAAALSRAEFIRQAEGDDFYYFVTRVGEAR